MRTFVILGLLVACVAPSAARADCVPAEWCFCEVSDGAAPIVLAEVVGAPEATADGAQTVEVRIVDSLGSTASVGEHITARLQVYQVRLGELLLVRADSAGFLRVNEARDEVRCAVDVQQQHFFVTLERATGLVSDGYEQCRSEVRHVYPRGTQPPYGCGATGSCSVRPARSETPNAPLAAIALAVVALRRRVKR